MPMPSRYIFSILAGALLVGAGILQIFQVRNVKDGDTLSGVRPLGLDTLITKTPAGWMSVDEPLGATEFMRSSVEKTLNYDDYINRVYQKSKQRFSLYVAYWSPGRMPVQKVASHTPDRCWTENGWTCLQLRSNERLTGSGVPLMPAQWRLFAPPGANTVPEYVVYWHLVGGELYDYGDGLNRRANPLKWWRDTVHFAVKGSAEQYFIRLTSDRPFDELNKDPGFQEILRALGKLGLAEG